jgi:hypothetical protein
VAVITVSEQDISLADTFLTAYLRDKISDADFSEGSVLRDFVVKAIAYIFAYLEKERKITRDRQSLLSLASLTAGESVDDAADALLSNWFLTRLTGTSATVTAVLHFSEAVDVTLLPTTRFFRTKTQAFTPKITAPIVIPASELRPNINANGTIADYSVLVTLVAATSGTAGNAGIGRFVSADPFSSFFLYAENLTPGEGGTDLETTAEILERAPTAISVRNLINLRSIDTVLKNTFPLTELRVIGMEDPEMIRDLSKESVSGLHMHVGGYTDIFVQTPRIEQLETLEVNGYFARPDGVINILTDVVIPGGFSGFGVLPGHVLRVNDGMPDTPREFLITAVGTTWLEVQPRASFPKATDEDSTFVTYSIGTLGPTFDNIVPLGNTGNRAGQTSRKVKASGHVVLKGQPQYKITSVEVLDTPTTVVDLSTRVNGLPGPGQYQVVTRHPANAQSAFAVTDLVVPTAYDGMDVRVRYETLLNYVDIQNYVRDRYERVVSSNPLVKGFNPVYLRMEIFYKLKSNPAGAVDPAAVSQVVADYVNAFSPLEVIELSGIEQAVRNAFPDIGALISPTMLWYDLLAPDGQVYSYSTQDLVTIFPVDVNNSSQLTNGASLRVPLPNASLPDNVTNRPLIDAANVALAEQLSDLGISDRTIVYYALAEDIVTQEVF